MTVLRVLCFLRLHPRRQWIFVGSSWQLGDHVLVCGECGREVNGW